MRGRCKMKNSLIELPPRRVWDHFAKLCEIPRASLHEENLIKHLREWADARGIENRVDRAGNLILRKAASAGCEAGEPVVLQGHLDMVCQANSGVEHDFLQDPISAVVKDGWVTAEKTTLGADNGIGVALALAVLEEPDLIHPAIEVLLTVNEECGMDGARNLEPGALHGKRLINLDSEEWGHFYLGCSGGIDVHIARACQEVRVPPGHALVGFDVSGLRGGHSGIDIHLGRGNAIKLLSEALRDLSSSVDLRLVGLKGGSARNAIPREAHALCALPYEIDSSIDEWVRHRREAWQKRFALSDPAVEFSCMHYDDLPENSATSDERDRILAFLDTVANGVNDMNRDFPGVTDTSSNLGVAALEYGKFEAVIKVRSLHDERSAALAEKLAIHAESYGMEASKTGAYPAWTPDRNSSMLELCQRVYEREFGRPAGLKVIHAGLECGLLALSHPHLDMISFGPDIRGAHAPGESVEIESVGRCWRLLKALLQELAKN